MRSPLLYSLALSLSLSEAPGIRDIMMTLALDGRRHALFKIGRACRTARFKELVCGPSLLN